MATSTLPHSKTIQSKRRALRSNAKSIPHINTPFCQASHDQVVDQIKSQIQHQEAYNATKISIQLQEDIKPFQQSPISCPEPSNACQPFPTPKSHNETFDCSISAQRPLQSSPQIMQNSLEEKIKLDNDKVLTKQKCFSIPVKPSFKRLYSFDYQQSRKSYRKTKSTANISIPFRRSQDQFECRLVFLINKVLQKKSVDREIETICQKIRKISLKDMSNPYVVSGIQAFFRLLTKVSNSSVKLSLNKINKAILINLQTQIQTLSSKIQSELGKIDGYEQVFYQQKKINYEQTKPKILRRIYKAILNHTDCKPSEARQKSLQTWQGFMKKPSNQANYSSVLQFIREQKFLTI